MRALLIACLFMLSACSLGSMPAASPDVAGRLDPLALQTFGSDPGAPTYRTGRSDLLAVSVPQIQDLSLEEVRIDTSGNLPLPPHRASQPSPISS